MSTKYGVSKLTKALRLMVKQIQSVNKDKVKLIGQDHIGNKYFEAHKPNHSRPVQRYYDAPKKIESFKEIVEAVHVPPAWDAWLRFRRQDPPSDEEVLEGEQYYQMQQEMARGKKDEEPLNRPTSFNQDAKEERMVPKGHYSKHVG